MNLDEHLDTLTQLGRPADPTLSTDEAVEIKQSAAALKDLPIVDRERLIAFVEQNPGRVQVLGLAVGLTQEKLKNLLKHEFRTSSWRKVGRERAKDLVEMLDDKYDVVRLVADQRLREYEFGDVLVARAGSRTRAVQAGVAGRLLEDSIESVARELGLQYSVRTRFVGREGRDAPCDLAIPEGGSAALIVVAAKGFDSTGSKLSDAVNEIKDMAEVRLPRQFVFAAVDGIGWKSRVNDLRRLHALFEQRAIDGIFCLRSLDQFRVALRDAASRVGLT